MIRPNPLKIGDKIGLIAPSSPGKRDRIEPAIKALEDLGLEVVLGVSCLEVHGFLSGLVCGHCLPTISLPLGAKVYD